MHLTITLINLLTHLTDENKSNRIVICTYHSLINWICGFARKYTSRQTGHNFLNSKFKGHLKDIVINLDIISLQVKEINAFYLCFSNFIVHQFEYMIIFSSAWMKKELH